MRPEGVEITGAAAENCDSPFCNAGVTGPRYGNGKVEDMLQIKRIEINTAVEENLAEASVEVRLWADAGQPAFLCAQLLSPDGGEADRILPVSVEEEMDFCMQISPVRLWNPEEAFLYDLVLELRDEKMQLLGTTAKKVGFYRWEEKDGARLLNGVRPVRRAFLAKGWESLSGEELRAYLAEKRRAHYNTVVAKKADRAKEEICLEYGICVEYENSRIEHDALAEQAARAEYRAALAGEDANRTARAEHAPANPDFELSVTQQGVLIENHCVYANASQYDLAYSLIHNGKILMDGRKKADVPPGQGRFVELPYPALWEPGEYLYRAALLQKTDTAWAQKGFEEAAGETLILNAFAGQPV